MHGLYTSISRDIYINAHLGYCATTPKYLPYGAIPGNHRPVLSSKPIMRFMF